MTFGLAGAHGTGKSTLAQACSRQFEIPYFDGSSGRIMRELGYNSVSQMDVMTRIEAQEKYLDEYLRQIALVERPFITDRTPLDMVGYMLAETTMHSDVALAQRILDYCSRAMSEACNIFDTIVFVKPFGVPPPREGKPQVDPAYQHHIQYIIEGTIADCSKFLGSYYYLRDPDLGNRVEIMSRIITQRFTKMQEWQQKKLYH